MFELSWAVSTSWRIPMFSMSALTAALSTRNGAFSIRRRRQARAALPRAPARRSGKKSSPSFLSLADTAVTSTTPSPARTTTEPLACLAILPVSIEML